MTGRTTTQPHQVLPAPVFAGTGAVDSFIEAILVAAAHVLSHRGDLASRLRELLGGDTGPAEVSKPTHMSIAEYALHRRVSERTVRYMLKDMTEGVHFHRDGRTGRRIILHVGEADRWSAKRVIATSGPSSAAVDLDQLSIDEVTRRRARNAMKRVRENR
jgi:hypothetical protein